MYTFQFSAFLSGHILFGFFLRDKGALYYCHCTCLNSSHISCHYSNHYSCHNFWDSEEQWTGYWEEWESHFHNANNYFIYMIAIADLMNFVYGIEQKSWHLQLAWKTRTKVAWFKRPRWFFIFVLILTILISFFLVFDPFSLTFRLKLCWGNLRNLILWWWLLLLLLPLLPQLNQGQPLR